MLANVVSLVRLLLSVIILVKLRGVPALQIQLLTVLTVLNQIYLIKAQPFENPRENKIALLNDAFVSVYLYANMILTDFNMTGEWRDQASMFLLCVLLTSIFVNILEMMIRGVKAVYPKIKAKICSKNKEQSHNDEVIL